MHELAALLVAADPNTGRSAGVLDPATGAPGLGLPTTDPGAYQDLAATLSGWDREPTAPVGSDSWLEQGCLRAEVHLRQVELEHARPWERAPYWYVESVGGALDALDTSRLDDDTYRRAYLQLLEDCATFLTAGARTLDPQEVPRDWAVMTLPAAAGLRVLLAQGLDAVDQHLDEVTAIRARRLRDEACAALERLVQRVRLLTQDGRGRWQVGQDVFAHLLARYHCLDLSPEQLWEQGWQEVAAAQESLTAMARHRDPHTPWAEQVARLKAERTPAEHFLTSYRAETERARELTLEHDLATVHDDQQCLVAPLPEFRRAGLPLGEMRTVAPYSPDRTSLFLITPADLTAGPERVAGHERDNCPTFIRSIVGHETYPGHHLQSVHHQLGTDRDSFLRFFRTPLFVEGWGLYVEDVLTETVFGHDDQALFARRNWLWRCLRLVIDTGLHTGRLSKAEAVALLEERTGMDPHMAGGEVDRYTRHDNPTYPSTYVLGRNALHDLRARHQARFASPGRFHDAVLAHGSPPTSLLGAVLDGESR